MWRARGPCLPCPWVPGTWDVATRGQAGQEDGPPGPVSLVPLRKRAMQVPQEGANGLHRREMKTAPYFFFFRQKM